MHDRHTGSRLLILLAAVLLAGGCGPEPSDDPEILARLPDRVDYNFHVKPILSDRCYKCHGPDENAREADLRLDVEQIAKSHKLESGGYALVGGSLRKSEVYRRLTSTDPSVMMPPPESNLEITEFEKALILRWIQQGAEYKRHWAFIPPEKQEPPDVKRDDRVLNDVDRFVLARLEREGLEPSPEADRERLLRRVTMDLTGLPPTLREIDAFLADDRADAYERVVDRLLATRANAERLAGEWMDVARYADSHGFHADGYRYMWPWRDWVIDAFHRNMPYDAFVTWQLAGDLLPDAKREQILATAFNRNHPMTAEGGLVDEEYRVEYVADRTNTFGRAFLGLTVECARCHDHKFDPISQKNYYQLSAFFDNIDELGMTGDDGNAGPLLPLPSDSIERKIEAVRNELALAEASLRHREEDVEKEGVSVDRISELPSQDDAAAHYSLEGLESDTRIAVSGDPETIQGPDGGSAVRFRGDFDYLSLKGAGLYERFEPFSIAIWVRPDQRDPYAEILGNAGHKNTYWRGYEAFLDSLNRVEVRLIHALPHNLIHVRSADSIEVGAWTHVAFTYDGSSRADGLRLYLDGKRVPVEALRDNLYKSVLPVDGRFQPIDQALRVGKSYRAFSGDDGIFRGAVDGIRIYGRMLTAVDVARLAGKDPAGPAIIAPAAVSSIAPAAVSSITPAAVSSSSPGSLRREEVREHYLHTRDRPYRKLLDQVLTLRKREHQLMEGVPEVMVMKEMATPRPTYRLHRGAYDAPAERVHPGTPESLLELAGDLPQNRLGLARWLFDPDHPLTARVAVNRYWAMLFGTGLVPTIEDFGSQGGLPSHPELLDYLALRFWDTGWDVKALLRYVVTSATYRQSSRASESLRRRDPDNRLLARGPSYRLPFEMIRDNALAASGLLVDSVGGPSVKPYQPPGLWREKGVFSVKLLTYEQDHGDRLYRRSLYTFIRRTSPPPAMTAFDVPDRNICIVSRQETNTPMQALVLMNDPQFVEAARVLAERVQIEAGEDVRDQLIRGFRFLTGRRPRSEELAIFSEIYREEKARFEKSGEDAMKLLGVGEHPRNESLDPIETAALAVTAGIMMNHDDAYMKR